MALHATRPLQPECRRPFGPTAVRLQDDTSFGHLRIGAIPVDRFDRLSDSDASGDRQQPRHSRLRAEQCACVDAGASRRAPRASQPRPAGGLPVCETTQPSGAPASASVATSALVDPVSACQLTRRQRDVPRRDVAAVRQTRAGAAGPPASEAPPQTGEHVPVHARLASRSVCLPRSARASRLDRGQLDAFVSIEPVTPARVARFRN